MKDSSKVLRSITHTDALKLINSRDTDISNFRTKIDCLTPQWYKELLSY